jgi:peptidoglycan/LPS O-acetylase OafA/YrhL
MAVVILFTIHIFPLLGSGPHWNSRVTAQAQLCGKNWWRNLFLVQNYFDFNEMCLPHLHYLTTYFHMYLVCLVLIFQLWRSPRKTIVGLAVLSFLTIAARFYLTIKYKLADHVYRGSR